MHSIFSTLPPLFAISFFLNFVWEVWHSQLYTTCLHMHLPRVVRLLTLQSLKDAFWISCGYSLIALVWNRINIVYDVPALGAFITLALLFAFGVEYHALRRNRWEYAESMPRLFGVGITPLLELAVTGTLALYLMSLI